MFHFSKIRSYFFSIIVIAIIPVSCGTSDSLPYEVPDYIDDIQESPSNEHITVETSQLMNLKTGLSPQPQGGDCWGDYFFQFSTNNGVVRIYNLAEKKLVQTYKLSKNDQGFVSNCHCNSVCFGSMYYEEGDTFPLLYVSTGYSSLGFSGALVYRVIQKDGVFKFSLVQTIRLPILNSSWTEFIPAGGVCYICYSSDYVVYKMPLPSVHDGDVIIDGSMNALEIFQFPSQPAFMKGSRNQGRMIHNGTIIFPSGVPQAGEASVLVFLDMDTRTYKHIFDFKELGLNKESESIFIWRDSLCVAFLDQIVSFEFTPNIL